MQFDFEIYRLSQKFLNDYPYNTYPELLTKQNRPYNCILIDIDTDYFICLPFRSHINHNNAYHFKKSVRSRQNKSGIDYTKMIIVKDTAYLESGAVVDQDEYNETADNINKIVKDAVKYLSKYIEHINGNKIIHPRDYQRNYSRSTLPYFDNILSGRKKVIP